MSTPDKTRISVAIGRTTEERARLQHERHRRTFALCALSDPNASEPGFEQQASRSQRAEKARPCGLGGRAPAAEDLHRSCQCGRLWFYLFSVTAVNANALSLGGDWLHLCTGVCRQGARGGLWNTSHQFDLTPLSFKWFQIPQAWTSKTLHLE